jgi:hypothetical protein
MNQTESVSTVSILGVQTPTVEIPAMISVGYRLLGSTKESNWDPGKQFGYEGGVKSALKRRAPGVSKDTSGVVQPPQPKVFVTDATAFPGLRLVYVHPDATSEQVQLLKEKLDTPPAVASETYLVEVPNPALFAVL